MHAFFTKLGALAMAPLFFAGGFGHWGAVASTTPSTGDTSTSTALSISSVSGPSTLAVDAQGTWTVNVSTNATSSLHYSVVWGDEGTATSLRSMAALVDTSGTFTHSYASKGTYKPTFTVTDDNGHTATKSATVTVGTEAKLHLTSVAPTSGAVGSTIALTGTGFTASSTVTIGGVAATTTLQNNGTLSITVPSLKTGTYNVRVLNGDKKSNVVSFKVTAKASVLSISGIDAPVSLVVGATGTWTVRGATTADNLHYSVVWGDEGNTSARMMASSVSTQTSSTFTHAYQTAGKYQPKFTISDDAGHSQSVSASVVVRADTSGDTNDNDDDS
ncbi:MAG: hypothetical protein JWN49_131 [Parcubacteria group bacterium]|nr:hypothetical protein [Parcubacteria group bacterium]